MNHIIRNLNPAHVFSMLLWLFPVLLTGQDTNVSMVPSEIPENVLGSWVNESNQIVLIVSSDYVIVQNQLFYHNRIAKNKDILELAVVQNYDVKYFSMIHFNHPTVLLDEGYKVTSLKKFNGGASTTFPKHLQGTWRDGANSIEISRDSAHYSNTSYRLDAAISADGEQYDLILYKSGNFYHAYNSISSNAHFLQTDFEKSILFRKETFLQKNRSAFLWSLAALLVLLGAALFRWKIVYTKKKEASKRSFIEMQLRSIRSQMNPHFLFNALSAIQNLINKGESDKANHYLTEFSQLMRLTLDKTEKGLVPLLDEIESVKKYLELEKLRFNFEYNIRVEHGIDMYLTEIPAMLIQPFVENSIVHGLKESDEEKKLKITFTIEHEKLICSIDDNGIGINAARQRKNKVYQRKGFGIKLAQDRISLINENHQTNSEVLIIDKSTQTEGASGTLVKVSIPLKY